MCTVPDLIQEKIVEFQQRKEIFRKVLERLLLKKNFKFEFSLNLKKPLHRSKTNLRRFYSINKDY
jgi:hypothetical protein